MVGVSFEVARKEIDRSFQEILDKLVEQQFQFQPFSNNSWGNESWTTLSYCFPIISMVLYVLSHVFCSNSFSLSGLLVTIISIVVISMVNYFVVVCYQSTEKNEIKVQLSRIYAEYQKSCQLCSENIDETDSVSGHIFSGHSLISIVNVFRNNKWLKIPALLLVTGDIISLMGGDVAPGKACELIADTGNRSPAVGLATVTAGNEELRSVEKESEHNSMRYESGAKIPIRRKGGVEQLATAERHRTISAESVEILRLSGDMRCFEMEETPLRGFLLSALASNRFDTGTDGGAGSGRKSSFIRKVYSESWRQSQFAAACLVLCVVVGGVLRLSLLDSPDSNWGLALAVPLANLLLIFSPYSMPLLLLLVEAAVTASLLASSEVVLFGAAQNGKRSLGHDELSTLRDTAGAAAPEQEEQDANTEFLDEDLDRRVEDIADATSTSITVAQFLYYFVETLRTRLFGESVPQTEQRRLSVPLSRSRLVENLGAISMVCFVDDDVICENFSVAEEIFLLVDGDREQGVALGGANKSNKEPLTKADFSATGAPLGSSAKGVVLDLHANPEATGSRFENPLWWRYLSSLKPIGLNAMLTHSSDAVTPSREGADLSSPSSHAAASTMSLAEKVQHVAVEKALVPHIREVVPAESLRELAEEIGFSVEDVAPFSRLIEVDVLAPGLENAHLLEDTHTWGQEESRRRGSLMPQVRGSIFKDSRGGGLQMMSVGDPSLVLNYCREYWDGSSITPLSAADRREVLSVYDRWKLEDFDVTAFGYAPVPSGTLQPLLDYSQLQSESRRKAAAAARRKSALDVPVQRGHPSFFFVDPSTSRELYGASRQLVKRNDLRDNAAAAAANDPQLEQLSTSEPRVVCEVSNIPFSTPPSDDDIQAASIDRQAEVSSNASYHQGLPDASVAASPEDRDEREEVERDAAAGCDDVDVELFMDDEFGAQSASAVAAVLTTDARETLTQQSHAPSAGTGSLPCDVLVRPLAKSISLDAALDSLTSNADSLETSSGATQHESDMRVSVSLSVICAERTKEPVHVLQGTAVDDDVMAGDDDGLLLKKAEKDEHYFQAQILGSSVGEIGDGHARHQSLFRRQRIPNSHSLATSVRQSGRAGMRHLWTLMRQQVFLGMAASSVPVRSDVPSTMEDLSAAGVRFVYFSPRNMKRSKPVAEKIGLSFDWNCAISLRDLDSEESHDPHRHISNYADWDVLARMPHGVKAIRRHLEEVDNVPLLVSLYTDATPATVEQMVSIFRQYDEVVLTIGSGYKAHNAPIYQSSDVATSICTLPTATSHLTFSENAVIDQFPLASVRSLCRGDIHLSFRLVALGTTNLLQTPYAPHLSGDLLRHQDTAPEQLRLSVLLEAIRKGRTLLLNCTQAMAFWAVALISLGLWEVVSLAVPISAPPAVSPSILLLFLLVHLPLLSLLIVQAPAPHGVMKNTPRKNALVLRPRDLHRFVGYLASRSGFVAGSIFLVGWFTCASTLKEKDVSIYTSLFHFQDLSNGRCGQQALWLVQDMMASQALLALAAQAVTLLERGQSFAASDAAAMWVHSELWFGALGGAVALHILVMAFRAGMRQRESLVSVDSFCCSGQGIRHAYRDLDGIVWILMVLLPLLGVALGYVINSLDNKSYRRYLQFLRLEFDTRLGMHSPR